MSLEDLHAELQRQAATRYAADEMVSLCVQAIAERIAEFKVGDQVVDADGVTWMVTRIKGVLWSSSGLHPEYYGQRIKKDGTPGSGIREIYRCPLRAVDKGGVTDVHG